MNTHRPAAASLILAVTTLAQSVTSTFESPDLSQGSGIYYADALVWYQTFQPGEVIDGWTVADGSADVVRHTTGTARDGSQSLDLNGFSPATLRRTFPTVAGTRYRLEFDFSGNPIDGRLREMEVHWNGTKVASFSWDPITRGNSFQFDMKWERRQVEFTATGASSTVDLMSVRPGASGPEIDNVSFTELPGTPVTIENAVLLTWPVPVEGPLGAILESAAQSEGPWQVVKPMLLSLTSDGKVAVTIPAAEAAKFYRIRPGSRQ